MEAPEEEGHRAAQEPPDVGRRVSEWGKLVGLDPYPETTDPIPAGDYRATFVLR